MVQYRWEIPVDEAQVVELYNSVGWSAYTNDSSKLMQALSNSLAVLTVWDQTQLVGLIRVVGDGISILYIQDILVSPSYQRQSIGTTLMRMILKQYAHVRQKVLLTDRTEQTCLFYESCGFKTAHSVECECFYHDTLFMEMHLQ